MTRMSQKETIISVIVLFTAAVLIAMPVAAAVSVDTTADYRGGESGQSQAVEMSYTLSPEENTISDVRIRIRSTDNSFVDYGSFKRSVNPGDADIQINNVGQGVFEIEELKPGEEVTLTFEAYPKTIKREELAMSEVTVEYVQQGQSLENRTVITADMSNSPWFQLQEADPDGGGGSSGLGLLLGILVGLILGAGGTYFAIDYL